MYCTKCESEVGTSDLFCQKCGNRIVSNNTQTKEGEIISNKIKPKQDN